MAIYTETHKPIIGKELGVEVVIRYNPISEIVSYRVSVTMPWRGLRKTVYYAVYTKHDFEGTTKSLAEKAVKEYLEKQT